MKTEIETAASPEVRKIQDLIHGINVAMMVTENKGGELHGRPMIATKADFDGTLWFLSNELSGKNAEIRQNQNVLLSYTDPRKERFVSLSGTADVINERLKIAEMWHPEAKKWFPLGVEDPELSVLRVHVHLAEYWDGSSHEKVNL